MDTKSDAAAAGFKSYLEADFLSAERKYKQALTAQEREAAPDRRMIGELLHGLGKVYATTAQYDKAAECFKRAKRAFEDAIGVEHPRVAITVREMADLSIRQGSISDSKQLTQRALEIWREFLIPSYEQLPDEMPSFEDLHAARSAKQSIANLCAMARKHAGEEPAWGAPFPLAAMIELGVLYRRNNSHATALQLFTQALEECANTKNNTLLRARVLHELAETHQILGDLKRADELYDECVKQYKSAELDEHPLLGDALFGMATNAEMLGDAERAERLYLARLGLVERLLGAQHIDVAYTVRKLAGLHAGKGAASTAEVEYKRALDLLQQTLGTTHQHVAETWEQLGRLYQQERKFDEAEALYIRAIDIATSSTGVMRPEVAIYYDRLADVYRHRGRFQKAESACQRALSIRRDGLISTHQDVIATILRMAKLYKDWAKFPDAEAYYRSALELIKQLHGEKSEQAASCLVSIASVCLPLGKFKEAETVLLLALSIYEDVFHDVQTNVALIEPLLVLGEVASALGRYREARSRYNHAEELIDEAYGKRSPKHLPLLRRQADLQKIQGKLENAAENYSTVIEIADAHHLVASDLTSALCSLAIINSELGNNRAVPELFERALRCASSAADGQSADTISVMLMMSQHFIRMHDDANALSYIKQALQAVERNYGPHHPLFARAHCELAGYYTNMQQESKAIEHYLRALQVMDQTLGPVHPELANTLLSLGGLWMQLGKLEDAETLVKRCLDIRERSLGSQDKSTIAALKKLAEIYRLRGREAEANQVEERLRLIGE